ncbi:MAG: hypothetical protein AB1411_04000 [Nitrospirota bacterium]
MNRLTVLLPCLLLFGCASAESLYDTVMGAGPLALSDVREDQAKNYLVDALNYWLGKPKDERVRVVGSPSQCAPLNTAEEVCEWRQPTQQVLFTYDKDGIGKSWSYRGDYGEFTNANYQSARLLPASSSRAAQQRETEWVHPTKKKTDLSQDFLECQSGLLQNPNVQTGSKYAVQVQAEKCLQEKGWVRGR